MLALDCRRFRTANGVTGTAALFVCPRAAPGGTRGRALRRHEPCGMPGHRARRGPEHARPPGPVALRSIPFSIGWWLRFRFPLSLSLHIGPAAFPIHHPGRRSVESNERTPFPPPFAFSPEDRRNRSGSSRGGALA
jgi:hypothetical protein